MSTLLVCKASRNRLSPPIVEGQLKKLASKAIGKTLGKAGWRHSTPDIEVEDQGGSYLYTASINFGRHGIKEGSKEATERQYADICRKFASAGKAWGWFVVKDKDEAKGLLTASKEKKNGNQELRPSETIKVEVPPEIKGYFSHIFDRESQIRVIHAAIQAAVASNFQRRMHVLCFGRPACGKTETLLGFEKMVGSHSVVKLDATSTTKAGAENLLLEMEQIPPILIIEEIEKCNPLNLPWLLGVLDGRGEIIKTNARIGSVRRAAKCLCLATANDLQLFNSVMSGALASRFQHKIFFPRPDRKILEKILRREIKEMDGREEWIKPALDYAIDVEKTNDPRRIISLLDGRDKLLTGEYQKDLDNIRSRLVAEMGEDFKVSP